MYYTVAKYVPSYYYYPERTQGSKTKIKVGCYLHGVFLIIPNHHKRGIGCSKCGYIKNSNNRSKSFLDNIKEFNSVHGSKYIYNEKTGKNHEKFNITCPLHGIFRQTVASHKQGHGCPLCKNESSGYNVSTWEERSKTSFTFDSFKIYIIECFHNNERFIKIR